LTIDTTTGVIFFPRIFMVETVKGQQC